MSDMVKKEINEAMVWAVENCYLQIQNVDVQIPYLIGAPGGGKTQCCHNQSQLIENCNVVSTHFAITPYEEHSGIPQFTKFNINNQEVIGTIWSFPAIMKSLYEISERSNMVIWLLDDMHLCGSIHMALLYELLTERKLRDYKLPNNVAMLLAGNHGHNKAGSKTMFSAIVNRIFMMPIFTSLESWKRNFAVPNRIHIAVQSFLTHQDNEKYFHEDEQVDSPWGSPRSWTRFANILNNKESWSGKHLNESDIVYLAQGHVSKEACSQFTLYYTLFNKFNLPEIIRNYKQFNINDHSIIDQYALAWSLCSYLTNVKDIKTIGPNFSFILYQYIKESPDLGSMIIRDMLDYEKASNRRNIYNIIIKELNELENGITSKLLEKINNA